MTVMVAIATRDQVATDDGLVTKWVVRTKGPGYMDHKPMEPLAEVEVPDIADWLRRRREWLAEGEDPAVQTTEDAGTLEGTDPHLLPVEDHSYTPAKQRGLDEGDVLSMEGAVSAVGADRAQTELEAAERKFIRGQITDDEL